MSAPDSEDERLARGLRRFRRAWWVLGLAQLATVAWPFADAGVFATFRRWQALHTLIAVTIAYAATSLVMATRERIARVAGRLAAALATALGVVLGARLITMILEKPLPIVLVRLEERVWPLHGPIVAGTEAIVGIVLVAILRARGRAAPGDRGWVIAPLVIAGAIEIVPMHVELSVSTQLGLYVASWITLVLVVMEPIAAVRRALARSEPPPPYDPTIALRVCVLAFVVDGAVGAWLLVLGPSREIHLDVVAALAAGVAALATHTLARELRPLPLARVTGTVFLVHFLVSLGWRGLASAHVEIPATVTKLVAIALLLAPLVETFFVFLVVRTLAGPRRLLAWVALAGAAIAGLGAISSMWLTPKPVVALSVAVRAFAAIMVWVLVQPPEEPPPEISVGD